MIDTPPYLVIRKTGDIELREYSGYIVAEVDVAASSLRDAAEQGFRPLADYIFGNNLPADMIEMTAPVTAEPRRSNRRGEKIAMTAPVTSSVGADGTYTVRFSMPPTWTMATLPKPNNPRVRLVEVGAHDVLAIKFRGQNEPERIASGGRDLLAFAAANDMTPEGEPAWAGYSAPYVPVPLRKWEMLLRVTK